MARTVCEQRPPGGARSITTVHSAPAEGRRWAVDQGPVKLRPSPFSDIPSVPARRPQLTASFKSITVPQTQNQDETSRATRHRRKLRISWTVLQQPRHVGSKIYRKRRKRAEQMCREGKRKSVTWRKTQKVKGKNQVIIEGEADV
ncbi:hypothetical protein PAMP_000157 [Pampus punctatissimus]